MARRGTSKAARRARRADASRRDIARAAARCFTRCGYESTTMRAIANECGFTASSLYTYFTGKDEIFQALLEDLDARFLDVFAQAMPNGLSFEQKLELLFMRFSAIHQEEMDAICLIASIPHGAPFKDTVEQAYADIRFIERFATWIDEHSTKKERGGNTSKDVAFFAWGVIHGFFLQWVSGGAKQDLNQKIPVILRLILRGLAS